MTNYEKSVIRNIIYAVETGGEVYGKRKYAAFTSAYANSSAEHAITIGAGQWYATEAKKLLERIQQANPTEFARLDTAGIASDLKTKDWSSYRIAEGSAKANCIVAIINTDTGRACQNALMDEQLEIYIQEAADAGVTALNAQMMCANFRHHGGKSAMDRILAKTKKPYTLDNLYAACQTDTGNQVGTYTSRQLMVYTELKKRIDPDKQTELSPEELKEQAIKAVLTIAAREIGYLEKRSYSNLYDKTANAGTGNYTKYWEDIKPSFQGQPWCACFVTWVMVQAFGEDTARKMFKTYPYVLCQALADEQGVSSTPHVGDVVLFHNGSRFSHTGLVELVNGSQITTIEGNTTTASSVDSEGGGVYRKVRAVTSQTKFVTLNYGLVGSVNDGGQIESEWRATGTGTCTGDRVNVRATPGGTVIGQLSAGNRFEVDGTKSGS